MKTITKIQWDALSDAEKAKYAVNPANAEEYILKEQPPAPNAPAPNPSAPPIETAEQRKATIDAEVARQLQEKADADELAKKTKAGEFETLYTELKPKHDDLTARLEKLAATVKELIAAREAGLSDKYKQLNPNFADLAEQLKWLDNAAKLQTADDTQDPNPGNRPAPKPGDVKDEKVRLEKARESMGEQYRPRPM